MAYLGSSLPKNYRPMVYARWLRSLRKGNDYFKLIDSTSYYGKYHAFIESVLERPHTIVRIAVLTDDADVALGFSVSEAQVLHYCHTDKDNRSQGIARSLVPFEIKKITHVTRIGMSIWNSKFPWAVFDPFA